MSLRTRVLSRCHEDNGYVLALGALLLVPLAIAVGFAIDVGAWYARAGHLQKAADSASLAGAAYLPDSTDAEAAARVVLSKNGLPDADANGTVDGTDTRIVFSYPDEQQFRVRLVDRDVELFFSGVVLDEMEIRRQAIAEYILPVAMGSPKNFLGTGDDPGDALPSGMSNENFWLAIGGPCASREQGEYLATLSDGNFPASTYNNFQCTGGSTLSNSAYRSEGYFYAISVPASMAGQPLYVEGFDAVHCPGSSGSLDSAYEETTMDTIFTLRGPDTNPYQPEDNPTISTVTYDQGSDCDESRTWQPLFNVGSATAGTYFVQVRTTRSSSDNTLVSGHNIFSLRASPASSWTSTSACSSDPTDAGYYDADCYQVYAIDWMGVYANIAVGSLYLAEIGDEHSGKQLEIRLWDSGEGAQKIEILDPNFASVEFDWEIIDVNGGGDSTPTGGWNGSVTQAGGVPCTVTPCSGLDVSGTGTAPNSNFWSTSKYNARLIRVTIDLPEDIAAAYSGKTWWRVRYTTSGAGSSTDRTTWSVKVNGDPVRLVE